MEQRSSTHRRQSSPPAPGAELAIAFTGAVAPEAAAAHAEILEDIPGAGLFAVTSPARLHAGWLAAARRRAKGEAGVRSHVEKMLGGLGTGAALVTVLDGHPATLSWLGSVGEFRVSALGVEKFGQSSDILDRSACMVSTPRQFLMRPRQPVWRNG